LVVNAGENDAPVHSSAYHPGRALRSPIVSKLLEMEKSGASISEIRGLIGRGRARLAAHDADYEEGLFFSGSSASLIDELLSVREVFDKMLHEYKEVVGGLDRNIRSTDADVPLRVIHGGGTSKS